METISAPYLPEKSSVSAKKAFKNPKKKSPRGSVPRKSAGNAAPPYLPPPYALYNSSNINYVYSQSQPPLLPLPLPLQRVNSSLPLPRVNSSLPSLNRGMCSPPRNAGKLSPDKPSHQMQKKTVKVVDPPGLTRTASVPIGFGSYPCDDPNGLDGALYPGPSFTLVSPPPSCLPMPRFSIKPKMSCYAEAAGTDDGATTDLRRLLRLP